MSLETQTLSPKILKLWNIKNEETWDTTNEHAKGKREVESAILKGDIKKAKAKRNMLVNGIGQTVIEGGSQAS